MRGGDGGSAAEGRRMTSPVRYSPIALISSIASSIAAPGNSLDTSARPARGQSGA